MIKYIECPTCNKKGVRVELSNENFMVITTGRPLNEFPCQARCSNCYRRIKYAVEMRGNNV